MRLPHPSPKVLGISCAALVILVLAWLPKTMEVTLHVWTERLTFALADTDEPRSIIQNMPLTSLKVRDFDTFSLVVQRLEEGRRSLVTPGSRVVLKNPAREGSLLLTGKALRLLQLPLAPGLQGSLYTDHLHRVFMSLQNSPGSQLEIAVQGTLTLTLNNVEVQDAQHKTLLSGGSHRLDVVPMVGTLILTQDAQVPWDLIMDFSQQITAGTGWQLPLALAPRLKISHVDFTREMDKKLVSAIKRLWVEPLIPEDKSRQQVYLQLREHEQFTLRSITLTEDGLDCTLSGYTTMVKVGADTPQENVVPSWLGYLVNHQVVQGLMNLWDKL
jgi:hypothetical protein